PSARRRACPRHGRSRRRGRRGPAPAPPRPPPCRPPRRRPAPGASAMGRSSRLEPAPGPRAARSSSALGLHVDLAAGLAELLGHFGEALGDGVLGAGRVADLLADLHRAELRPAHRAEVRRLVRLLWQGLVMEGAGGFRVEPEVELILPAELETGAA